MRRFPESLAIGFDSGWKELDGTKVDILDGAIAVRDLQVASLFTFTLDLPYMEAGDAAELLLHWDDYKAAGRDAFEFVWPKQPAGDNLYLVHYAAPVVPDSVDAGIYQAIVKLVGQKL